MPDTPPVRQPRLAGSAEAATVTQILVEAFYADPLWSWAFPDPDRRREQHRAFWRLMVDGALRYPGVWLAPAAAATAVWIPPGGTELSMEQEAQVEPLLQDHLGAGASRVLAVNEILDRAHPHDEPHHYLTLLGTADAHRGEGVGMRLLAANLELVDADGIPAYLESSNPANVGRYESVGFRLRETLQVPGGPELHTMWRPAAR